MENNIILYTTKDGKAKVELYEMNDNIWLPQSAIAKLFDTSKQNINLHIQNIFKEGELIEDSVVKYFLTTAADGKKFNDKRKKIEAIESDINDIKELEESYKIIQNSKK